MTELRPMRIGGWFLAWMLLLWIAVGCASPRPMVKIGLIAPFEDLYRADGYASLHAVQLAVAERNAAGGVAGRHVALVALNDNGRAGEAELQAAKLGIDRDVLGVIGPIQVATAAGAAAELSRWGLPWIALVPLEAAQATGGFVLSASPEAVARAAVVALSDQGVVAQVPVFSDQPGAQLGAQQAAQGTPIQLVSLPTRLVESVVSGDAAIWLGDAEGGARLAQRMAEHAEPVLVGGPDLSSPVYEARAGAAAAATTWISSGPDMARAADDARFARFASEFRQRAGGDPGPQAILAYDAANLLLDALEEAGSGEAALDRMSVRRALLQLGESSWSGLSGDVTWQALDCGESAVCQRWRDAPTVLHRVLPAKEGK